MECCGGESYNDYETSNWVNTQEPSDDPNNFPVPATCCKNYLTHHDRTATCQAFVSQDRQKNDNVWEKVSKHEFEEVNCISCANFIVTIVLIFL